MDVFANKINLSYIFKPSKVLLIVLWFIIISMSSTIKVAYFFVVRIPTA